MTRSELTLLIAGVLVAAVLLGWILRGIFTGLNAGRRIRAAAGLAERLHAAEEAQTVAERRLGEREVELGLRLAEAERELDRTLHRLDAAREEVAEVRAAYRAAVTEGRPQGR